MVSEYDIKQEIRRNYCDGYRAEAHRAQPALSVFAQSLGLGGIGAVTTGVMGMAGAIVTLLCSAGPFGAALFAGSAVFFAAGVAGYIAGGSILSKLDHQAETALDKDVNNFKLVRKYFKEVLKGKQEDIDRDRAIEKRVYELHTAEIDKRQFELDSRRAATLSLLGQGMQTLENDVEAAQEELKFFRQEAATLTGEFSVAAESRSIETPSVPSQRPRVVVKL